MGHMIIDGRKVEFTDEKMSCLSSARQGSIFRHCATTQRYPLLVPVVYVQLKMRGEKHLPHVLNSQEMEW